MTPRIAAVATLIAVMALAGCGIAPVGGPDPRVPAQRVAAATCPESDADEYATAGLVPTDFEPVAVLRCDPYAWLEDDNGSWSGARLERLEGDLTAVLAALAQPSDPASTGPCPAVAYLLPELWIAGADTSVVRVAIPSTGCGAPKDVGLDAALDALTVVAETFTRESLVESPEAKAAGCATRSGVLIIAGAEAVVGAPLPPATEVPKDAGISARTLVPFDPPGWPDPDAVTGARLCDYVTAVASPSAPSPAGDGGVFDGVRALGASEAQAIIAHAQQAPAAGRCAEIATRFVVIQPLLEDGTSVPVTVEIDGCRRLIDVTLQAREAPDAVLALLEAAR